MCVYGSLCVYSFLPSSIGRDRLWLRFIGRIYWMANSKQLFSGIRSVEVINSYLKRKHKKQAETLTGILLLLTMLHVCLWEGLASPLSKVHSPLAT